jgi:hypothetical protein
MTSIYHFDSTLIFFKFSSFCLLQKPSPEAGGRYDYQSTLPKILLETITARTATVCFVSVSLSLYLYLYLYLSLSLLSSLQLVLALTYIIFILGLSFDIYTTVKGFGGENVELSSTSCFEQNIVIGVTEGNYGPLLSLCLFLMIFRLHTIGSLIICPRHLDWTCSGFLQCSLCLNESKALEHLINLLQWLIYR